jgi:hypothetical protein
MLKYRFLLASILLFAFLDLGHTLESGPMPAELEISLDRSTEQGLGYHTSGTIPLQLSDRDNVFVVKAQMPAYWRLTPVYRKCRLNVAFITLQVVGRQIHDRLTLALSLTPEVLRPPCSDHKPMQTTFESRLSTGDLNSVEFTLFVVDGSNDERTVEDSSHLGKLTGKLTLHLACPVRLVVSESLPLISVSPRDAVPWPLVFDDSKTSAELSILAGGFSAVVGLTRPTRPYPPSASFLVASRHAALRQGFCFWVKSIEVEFTPVEILLASDYPTGSCEYKATREHEMLHYQDLQMLFIRYRALVIAALRQAGFPTVQRPVFVGSVVEATNQSQARLRSTLQPIYSLMKKARQADADARDAPEQRVLTWSKCTDWYLRSTVRPTASLPSDLNRETMDLVPEQAASEFRRGPNK